MKSMLLSSMIVWIITTFRNQIYQTMTRRTQPTLHI